MALELNDFDTRKSVTRAIRKFARCHFRALKVPIYRPKKVPIFRAQKALIFRATPFQWPSKWSSRAIETTSTLIVTKSFV
jgi:hypothetical protein